MGGSLARAGRAGVQYFLELCFPPVCPGCDRALVSDATIVCENCREELSGLAIDAANRCRRCFQSLESAAREELQAGCGNTDSCMYCRSRPVHFDSHLSLAPMQGLWREVVHRWKYENDRRLWRLFCDLESRSLPDVIWKKIRDLSSGPIDRIVWIDSGPAGRQLRNFQPCADVARALVPALRPRYGAGADLRKRKSKQQSGQSYADRFFAMHDSLEYCGSHPAARCLLVEDVFTTGATANEAARILKKNGALQVIVFSLLLRDGQAG